MCVFQALSGVLSSHSEDIERSSWTRQLLLCHTDIHEVSWPHLSVVCNPAPSGRARIANEADWGKRGSRRRGHIFKLALRSRSSLLPCSRSSPPDRYAEEVNRSDRAKMQAEDMEVPFINNLNDNGDRQRPKGKDVFKDQQKESEVNARGVRGQCRGSGGVCAPACVCVVVARELCRPPRPAPARKHA